MITLSRNRPARGSTCQRCRIIRSFIAFTIMLGIFSLVADDSARFLQIVTPERAASAIWIAGGMLFVVKIAVVMAAPSGVSADRAPAEQPAAEKGKTRVGMSSKEIHRPHMAFGCAIDVASPVGLRGCLRKIFLANFRAFTFFTYQTF